MLQRFRQTVLRAIMALAAVLFVLPSVAQVTTASMAGQITEDNKEPIIGASIVAIHEPSGTRYTAISNVDGRYSIQGMRVGGPYTVRVSYVGMQPVSFEDIMLQLGEIEELNVYLTPGSTELGEIVVKGRASKFQTEKTGATTNISNAQILSIPTVSRSIEDIARLSPYANGMSFAGGDGRSSNFTIDGANFNNNFGLTENLPGGGSPISMDALEEMQVVVAPFDVRQTNFIGGGVNAITKSGTNQFKGSAYVYYTNQDLRGNRINGEDLGGRADESKTIYGFTVGGPIIKNKLFFFANYEHETTPGQVIKYRARQSADEAVDGMVSRTLASDMDRVAKHLRDKYGYDTGSYTSFPGDESNNKFLVRLDWNINDRHKVALRFNHTKNLAWNAPNNASSDAAYRLNGTYRVGPQSMSFANSMYSMENKVTSWSADFNSRFTDNLSNQLLFTYTAIKDMRGSNSSPFPFIDIMAGYDATEGQIWEPYISAGYELFTWNNGVNNKIVNLTDNVNWTLGSHRLMAGISYEHQFANNAYMRNGTGYYRYRSIDDFLNGAAPETFALTYGWNGEKNPNAQVTFNQLGFYLQDEWNIAKNFKLTYGVRLDDLFFDNSDLARNKAIYALDFGGQHIDTGKWPTARLQVSPRVGFNWDPFKNGSLRFRGGTGIFTGRLPLVFFTNMPTNAGMVQNSYSISAYDKFLNYMPENAAILDKFKGGLITDVDKMIETLGLPTQISDNDHVAGSKISGVADNFHMPQVWKSSLAVDWQVPVKFPFTVTGEFMYTRHINALKITNINIKPLEEWNGGKGPEYFEGPDNRLKYSKDYQYINGKNAVILGNTHKGHGWTANLTMNARPIDNLGLMFAYTHTESKEVSGMPGNDPVSTWQGNITVDGPNFGTVQRSRYVIPDRLIASATWTIPFQYKGLARNTNLSLFYTGYSNNGYSFCYSNDMNGDGINNDLIYIPAKGENLNFKDPADATAFEAFIQQDKYLSSHRGQYAESYAARAPWVHQFDLRLMEEFEFNIGKTKHAIQLSFDIMNIGNLFNSSWGVPKVPQQASNNLRVLKYEGVNAQNQPTYSMLKNANGEYYSKSYDFSYNNSYCWQMQIGVKYIFK